MLCLMKALKHGQGPPGTKGHIILGWNCDGIAIKIMAKKTYGTCWYQLMYSHLVQLSFKQHFHYKNTYNQVINMIRKGEKYRNIFPCIFFLCADYRNISTTLYPAFLLIQGNFIDFIQVMISWNCCSDTLRLFSPIIAMP